MQVNVNVVNVRHRYLVTFRRFAAFQPDEGGPITYPISTASEQVEVVTATADQARALVEGALIPGELLKVLKVQLVRDESTTRTTTHFFDT